MREISTEVLARVREELTKRPSLPTGVLYHMAQGIDSSLAAEGVQRFHSRYVVPVKHEQARMQRRRPRARTSRKPSARQARNHSSPVATQEPATLLPRSAEPERDSTSRRVRAPRQRSPAQTEPTVSEPRRRSHAVDRRQIRAVFLEFARDLAQAESRAEMVQALGELDRYIEQVVRALR